MSCDLAAGTRNRSVRAIITGVPAAGKSTLASLVSLSRPDLRVYELGQTMAALAVAAGLVQSLEGLPQLEDDVRARLQVDAAAPLADSNAPLLVVAHLLVLGPNGMRPGLPPPARAAISPDWLVVVECDPGEIVRRRAGGTRIASQPVEREDAIAVHQRLVLAEAEAWAREAALQLMIVRGDGAVELEALSVARLWPSASSADRPPTAPHGAGP